MDYLPVANVIAVQGVKYLPAGAWTEAKVSTTRQHSRKWVEIYNRSPYKLYYSYDNTTNVEGSFAIKAGGILFAPLSESVGIYLQPSISSGSQKVVLAEVA